MVTWGGSLAFWRRPLSYSESMDWLIIGLGNPGTKYNGTRHNIGFDIVDAIADQWPSKSWQSKYQGLVTTAEIGSQKCVLLKPQTFMNLSGRSAGQVMRFYKLPPEKVLVVHDDLDLHLARLKLKQGGGHGGHNGLKSVDQHIGKNYWRLRFGIDRPEEGRQPVEKYVLESFRSEEQSVVGDFPKRIAKQLPVFLETGDHSRFLNKIVTER